MVTKIYKLQFAKETREKERKLQKKQKNTKLGRA